jgi:hypothetical protein
MMLDSGAGVTTLDKAFAAKIGLTGGQKITAQGVGGQQEAELFQNVTIEVGNLKFAGATVVAIDLTQVSKAIGRPMPVVLGRELFIHSCHRHGFRPGRNDPVVASEFHPSAGRARGQADPRGYAALPPDSIAGLPPVLAAFDLGNGGAISLSQEYQAKQQ